MKTVIVVDGEYTDAAQNYGTMAAGVQQAIKYFSKTVVSLAIGSAIKGETARNMLAFLSEMNRQLHATFQKQISLEASLCKKYIAAIDRIDSHMSFFPFQIAVALTGNTTPDLKPHADVGRILFNADAVKDCVSRLNAGPVKDIREFIESAERIDFSGSQGDVKNQNMIVKEKVIASLKALNEIFSAFIDYMEGAVAAMVEKDAAVANSLASGTMP